MRILFANDGIGDAGGVQQYLAAVLPALAARGHEVALLHLDRLRPDAESPAPAGTPHFCLAEGAAAALAAAREWRPGVVFSHNLRPLDVERALLATAPTVKMMHGYFGTCVGGQKAHLWPDPVPCGRALGAGCAALYFPRRCGPRRPGWFAEQWTWAHDQRDLLARYAAVVTASRHVRDEYVRNGAPADRAHAIPLFPTLRGDFRAEPPAAFRILFLGRMTTLKGGDLLVRAVAEASRRAGRALPLTMAGDGPQRAGWAELARSLGVDATFPGWVHDDARGALLADASLLAVPSVWPEPFGLVGLEAGVAGVPAVAFDVGGIREWLTDGTNGWLAPGDPPTVDGLATLLVRAAEQPGVLAGMRIAARAAAERMSLDVHLATLEAVLDAAARGR